MREVVVLSAVRSAVGGFNGSLASFEPAELGGLVMKEAIARAKLVPQYSYGSPFPLCLAGGIDSGRPAHELGGADDQSALRLCIAGGGFQCAKHHAG